MPREESQKELLEVIQDWSLGKRIQEFLAEVAEKSAVLDKKERSAIGERLKMAQSCQEALTLLSVCAPGGRRPKCGENTSISSSLGKVLP